MFSHKIDFLVVITSKPVEANDRFLSELHDVLHMLIEVA